MEKNMNEKSIKIGILSGVLVIAFSVFYYLVIRPVHNSNELGKCLERAEKVHGYGDGSRQNYRDNCFKQF